MPQTSSSGLPAVERRALLIDTMAHHALFSHVTLEQRELLLKALRPCVVHKGERVIQAGERSDFCYFVESGTFHALVPSYPKLEYLAKRHRAKAAKAAKMKPHPNDKVGFGTVVGCEHSAYLSGKAAGKKALPGSAAACCGGKASSSNARVKEIANTQYKSGSVFGELALLHPTPRPATVACQKGGTLWRSLTDYVRIVSRHWSRATASAAQSADAHEQSNVARAAV